MAKKGGAVEGITRPGGAQNSGNAAGPDGPAVTRPGGAQSSGKGAGSEPAFTRPGGAQNAG